MRNQFAPSLLQRLKLFSFASLFLFAGPALAQAVTKVVTETPAAAPSGVDWHNILGYIIQGAMALALTTVLPTVLIPLLPKIPALTQHLLDWVKHQAAGVQNAYAAGVLNRLISLAGQKVLALENTEVAYLREQLSSGTITTAQLPTLMAGVKQRAIDAVKADANSQGLWKIALSVFLGSDSALTNWLGDVVESHVAQLSSNPTNSKVAPSTPAPSTTAALKAAPAVPQKAAP